MYYIKCLTIALVIFFLLHRMSWAETITETYNPGLVLQFIPKGDTEPFGTMIDQNTTFIADSYKKSKPLVKYSGMPHWLLWQGFYKAEKPGKHVFVFNGKSYSGSCKFEASLAGDKLFSLSGHLTKLFGHKTLNLDQGVHKFKATLSCADYRQAFGEIEIKRPGENTVGKIKSSELLYRR